MKQDNVIKIKSIDFAVRIVNMIKYLVKQIPYAEHPICTQLLKSGTSIGANIRETEHAESTEDFIHKLKIALRKPTKLNIGWNYSIDVSISINNNMIV